MWLVQHIVADSELVAAWEARISSPKNVVWAGVLEGRVKLGPDDLFLHWDWWLAVFHVWICLKDEAEGCGLALVYYEFLGGAGIVASLLEYYVWWKLGGRNDFVFCTRRKFSVGIPEEHGLQTALAKVAQ